jgi:hypothetical protein
MPPPLKPGERKPWSTSFVLTLIFLIFYTCIMPCDMLPGPFLRRFLGLTPSAVARRPRAPAAAPSSLSPLAPPPAALAGPEVAAIYVFYRRPKSFVHAVTAFRKAYPASTMVLICDEGCFNYSVPAAQIGATYLGEPHRLSMKKHGAFYVGPQEALNMIRAYRDAVARIKEPYYMQLEDDVYTLRRITSPLLGAINGMAKDKSIVREAEQYIKDHNPGAPYPYLGGFGGCVYNTAFWRRVLNMPTIEEEINDLYSRGGDNNYGVDYIMSTLLWRFGDLNGTMHDWKGYIESFREDAPERIARGEIEVMHGFKSYYGKNKGDLTWEERAFLGPFDKGMEGEQG